VDPISELQDCETNHDEKFNTAREYIKKIAKVIANANPKTFSGPYAIENFCFSVNRSPILVSPNYATVNGWANSWTRHIGILPLTFHYAKTDDDIAALIAHELAHILRQHRG